MVRRTPGFIHLIMSARLHRLAAIELVTSFSFQDTILRQAQIHNTDTFL